MRASRPTLHLDRRIALSGAFANWDLGRSSAFFGIVATLFVYLSAESIASAAQVGAEQISSGAGPVIGTEQIGRAVSSTPDGSSVQPPAPQIGAPVRHSEAVSAPGVSAREAIAPAQLTTHGRTAAAPPAVSSRRDGRNVAVEVVHGHDRCDPALRAASRQQCASILDYRANQFGRASAPTSTVGNAVTQTPPASSTARESTAAQRLSTAAGADPTIAAEAAAIEGTPNGAQAAAIAATNRDPAVPLGAVAPPTTAPPVTPSTGTPR